MLFYIMLCYITPKVFSSVLWFDFLLSEGDSYCCQRVKSSAYLFCSKENGGAIHEYKTKWHMNNKETKSTC